MELYAFRYIPDEDSGTFKEKLNILKKDQKKSSWYDFSQWNKS